MLDARAYCLTAGQLWRKMDQHLGLIVGDHRLTGHLTQACDVFNTFHMLNIALAVQASFIMRVISFGLRTVLLAAVALLLCGVADPVLAARLDPAASAPAGKPFTLQPMVLESVLCAWDRCKVCSANVHWNPQPAQAVGTRVQKT